MNERPMWEKPRDEFMKDLRAAVVIVVSLAASIAISTEIGKILDNSPREPQGSPTPIPGASRPADTIPQGKIVSIRK